jgi:hypothetical protein
VIIRQSHFTLYPSTATLPSHPSQLGVPENRRFCLLDPFPFLFLVSGPIFSVTLAIDVESCYVRPPWPSIPTSQSARRPHHARRRRRPHGKM